jgi:hypothetical protein
MIVLGGLGLSDHGMEPMVIKSDQNNPRIVLNPEVHVKEKKNPKS